MGTELKAFLNSLIDQILTLCSLKVNEMMAERRAGNYLQLLVYKAASFAKSTFENTANSVLYVKEETNTVYKKLFGTYCFSSLIQHCCVHL